MKYLSIFFIALTLLFAGCDDDSTETSSLSISSADVEFDASGGTGTIYFTASGDVTASSSQTWLTITSIGSESLTYSVEANSEIMSRSAIITLTTGDSSTTISVVEMGAILGLEESYTITAVAQSNEFEIYTNYDDITVTSADSWLTASISDGVLTLTPELNTGSERSTTITITAGWKTTTAEVIQSSLASVSSIEMEQDGTAVSFTIDEAINDIDANWTVTAADEWLTVTISGQTVTVTGEANETGKLRTSELTITVGGYTITITVSQTGIGDYYEYFQGEWTLHYGTDGNSTLTVTLSANDDGTGYIMSGLAYDVELGYDSTTHQMTLLTQYVGMYYNYYYVYLCPWDSTSGYYTWSSTVGSVLTFNDDETNNVLTISDNGVWRSYTVRGWLIRAFTSSTPSSSTSAGNIARYANMYQLTRTIE